jgi:hypothetical protein
LHDPASIDDIDNLYTRLEAVPDSVVGILVSYSGFTEQVLARVRERSNTPVLLLSGSELQAALRFTGDLHNLLRRKKKTLLVDRQVLLDDRTSIPPRTRGRARVSLPATRTRFLTSSGERTTSMEFGGGFGQFVFARELPDIDWSASAGLGATADIPLPIWSEEQLIDLIYQLADMGWATEDARWSIQQASVNWHGMGPAAFAELLPAWKKRYRRRRRMHDSEELCYADACDGGFYTLTANVAADVIREVRCARLSFQLVGTPLDLTALRELCEVFDVREQVYFRTRESPSVTRARLDRPYRTVEPVALLVEPDDAFGSPAKDFVTGPVIPNPFGRCGLPAQEDNDLPSMVADSEHGGERFGHCRFTGSRRSGDYPHWRSSLRLHAGQPRPGSPGPWVAARRAVRFYRYASLRTCSRRCRYSPVGSGNEEWHARVSHSAPTLGNRPGRAVSRWPGHQT